MYRCQLSPGNREHEIRTKQRRLQPAAVILFPAPRRQIPRETERRDRTSPIGESLMEYSCPNYELACNECGKRFGNRPLSGCPDCLAPLEIVYDLLNAKGIFTRDSIAGGPANI